MLVSFKEIVEDAKSNGYAVGYFEAWDIYSLEAVVEAAEEANTPAIIGFGESIADYSWYESGGIEKLASFGLTAANFSKVPLGFIFNEIASFEHAMRGIKSGYNIVMLDSAQLNLSKHVELTKQVVKVAHSVGVAVEAELGVIPQAEKNGSLIEGSYTDPKKAAEFVQETNIDALAVSIGNVHLLNDASAKIDIDLLKRIHNSVNIPLVVHGGSGLPDSIIPELIKNGVVKINVGTILKRSFFEALAKAINSRPSNKNIHEVLGSRMESDILLKAKLKMRDEILRLIKVYNPNL